MNGGSCTNGVNSYSCDCASGYTGEDWEIGMCYITKTLFTLNVLMGNVVCRINIFNNVCIISNFVSYKSH